MKENCIEQDPWKEFKERILLKKHFKRKRPQADKLDYLDVNNSPFCWHLFTFCLLSHSALANKYIFSESSDRVIQLFHR